jgi:excisionase family DNA binding protein
MGSKEVYITVEQAAKILGVHFSQVHAWERAGWLEAYYPGGRVGGKRFREEDVRDFLELRGPDGFGFRWKLPQLAMKAVISSRRSEKRIEEIARYLGLDAPSLGVEKEEVLVFLAKLEEFRKTPKVKKQVEAIELARTLLAVTEEYLDLVSSYTGDKEPWKVFLDTAKILAEQCSPGTDARGFAEHARRNLRNVAYFYLRASKGPHEAGRLFPGESYTSRLIRTLFPS